jgi:hypothetical protein
VKQSCFAAALVVALSGSATAQVAILQIQITEGEGAVYAPGAKSARPLAVEVTDETGRPVAGAAVSFHLPETGAGGTFVNGLRTEVATTDERGRAALRGLQLNHTPGRFEIRIIASKEQARAGTVSFEYIADPASGIARAAGATPKHNAASRGHTKWIVIGVAVAGGAAAGLVAGHSSGKTAPGTAVPAATTLSVGTPTITVGHP